MAESSAIDTPRLTIVPFAERHLTMQYVSWLNDPLVVKYSEQRHKMHTHESCKGYWQSFQGTPNFFWAIQRKDGEPSHIGNINAYIDISNMVADVGIVIGERSLWGNGFGLEAWNGVCQYLLTTAKMRKVTAGTLSINTGMIQIIARSGMKEDGRRIRQILYEGTEVDIIHAAFFVNDTKPSPNI